MSQSMSSTQLESMFRIIFSLLSDTKRKLVVVWFEITEFLDHLDIHEEELYQLVLNFESIKRIKGNYTYYVSVNKVLFILEALRILNYDITMLCSILDYAGFEQLIYQILLKNNFFALTNFRFSDTSDFQKTTKQKRYEIDVIGVYRKYMLIIDAKQWKKKDSFSAMNRAANLQYQRVKALKKNPLAFSDLIHQLLGPKPKLKKYLPLNLIPLMVTLEENSIKLNKREIPLVSIYKFSGFLREFPSIDLYKTEKIKKVSIQQRLF
ncbi:MAG: NERD domain-containing protein [Promethearchaeia archaeon]